MATTVKVDRVILLTALQARYDEQMALQEENEKAIAKYEKEEKAYNEKLVALSHKLAVHSVRVLSHRGHHGLLEIEYTLKGELPAEPQKPDRPNKMMWESDTEELGKAIKLLNMTTDPQIPTSLYKSVSNWL